MLLQNGLKRSEWTKCFSVASLRAQSSGARFHFVENTLLIKSRSESAHALRGVAAFAVAWFHFTNGQPTFLPEDSLLKVSGAYGYLGVAVFFVISGFVIPYSLDGAKFPDCTKKFFSRRIWRIYPPYLIAIAITIALTAASSLMPGSNAAMPSLSLSTIIGNLTYTAPWIGEEWLSPIFWSLAIEIQFYLVVVAFAPVLLSKNRIVIFATLFVVSCFSFVPANKTFLLWYLPTFGAGICWYLYFTNRLSMTDAAAQGLGFAFVAWFTMGLAYALAIALALAAMAIPLRRSVPILSFLGTISYSIYLLHSPIGGRVINLATRLPNVLIIKLVALALAVTASIAAAYLMWRFIELPASARRNHPSTAQ
jgi:peptidoglycan/LPS O-acetylase OafA/YrhL